MKTVKNSDEVERVLERAKHKQRRDDDKEEEEEKIATKNRQNDRNTKERTQMGGRTVYPERMDNEEEEVRILSYNVWFDNNHAARWR